MNSKRWIGIILILLGVGFILQRANIWEFSELFSTWWPLIIIIGGLFQFGDRSRSSNLTGTLFVIVGGFLLANRLYDVNLIGYLWPTILVIIGLFVVFARPRKEHGQWTHSKNSADSIDSLAIFSGTEQVAYSEQFTGGNVLAIFGGADIDLRDAKLAEEGGALELVAIFGGINVRVPEDMRLEVTGLPIFGGLENKTRKQQNMDENTPTLKIHFVAAFGGVEIRD